MILPAEKETYELVFPKEFIPTKIKNKYKKYLERLPDSPITDAQDYVSHTIQRTNFPGFEFTPATQSQRGQDVSFRASVPYQNLFNKELTVSFLATDSWINYFILLETAIYWYERSTRDIYLPPFRIYMTDSFGFRLCTLNIQQVLFTYLDPLECDYSDDTPDSPTFEARFTFNKIYVELLGEDINA